MTSLYIILVDKLPIDMAFDEETAIELCKIYNHNKIKNINNEIITLRDNLLQNMSYYNFSETTENKEIIESEEWFNCQKMKMYLDFKQATYKRIM